MKPVLIVGAGWSGAVVASTLTAAGVPVEVLERASVVGGHSRMESLNGCFYEANGPHLLHTDNPEVAGLFDRLGLSARPYRFRPLNEIVLADGTPRMMSWPIQVEELEALPDWPTIRTELDALPDEPSGDDFESYAVSLMGRRLYELFIRGYTRKQWGCEPSELSSSFAPKRIDLRWDGNRDLFKDRWQFYPPQGVNGAIEELLRPVAVTCGAEVTGNDLDELRDTASAIVLTCALDDFLYGARLLAWRGIRLRSSYYPCGETETMTAAHVVNYQSADKPYTRTTETKHGTSQRIAGTVVSEEYPGADARHYPVPTVDHRHERKNGQLQDAVRKHLAPLPVFFCGRLAQYVYINQDQAIEGAWACANDVLGALTTKATA